jgi:hypothetical protein
MKTKKTGTSVADFLNSIPEMQKREDCQVIARMMQEAVKAAPEMWGPSIVGFGQCHLVYSNGKEIDWESLATLNEGKKDHRLRSLRWAAF